MKTFAHYSWGIDIISFPQKRDSLLKLQLMYISNHAGELNLSIYNNHSPKNIYCIEVLLLQTDPSGVWLGVWFRGVPCHRGKGGFIPRVDVDGHRDTWREFCWECNEFIVVVLPANRRATSWTSKWLRYILSPSWYSRVPKFCWLNLSGEYRSFLSAAKAGPQCGRGMLRIFRSYNIKIKRKHWQIITIFCSI